MKGPGICAGFLVAGTLACGRAGVEPGHSAPLFAEDFESGTLSTWSDAADSSRFRVLEDRAFAQSGSRYLAVTYPAGQDGGWLTRMLSSGHESLYVSYHVRFPGNWAGGTKLLALYGSRRNDPWSAFGKAGVCPNGADFFSTTLVREASGETKFYTYYPRMRTEPDGVTCWGRFGDGSEAYVAEVALTPDAWHHVEFLVALNTPGTNDARQTFWIDGVESGTWAGFSFRDVSLVRLNAVQLSFSVTGGVQRTQELYVDNLVVLTSRPSGGGRQ